MDAQLLQVERTALVIRAAYIVLSTMEDRDDCAMGDALAAIGSE